MTTIDKSNELSAIEGAQVSSAALTTWSDEDLLIGYRSQGERKLFEELMRRYERELLVFLRRFLGDAQLAEDTFQATFLAVHLRMDQYHETRRFKPWVYAIASNKAIDLQRWNKRHRIASLDAPILEANGSQDTKAKLIEAKTASPIDFAVDAERADQVRVVVGELSPAAQELIELAFFQSMRYADISERLGIPVGTVKSRVHTAMGKLREAWVRKFPKDDLSDRLRSSIG